METFTSTGYHGRGGPLTIETSPYLTPLGQSWPSAGHYLGYKFIDINGPTQTGKREKVFIYFPLHTK